MNRNARARWVKLFANRLGSKVLGMLAGVCVLGVPALQVYATVLPYYDLHRLIAEADGIVMGTVRSIESAYDPHREIYTFVTLDQLNVIHGSYDQAALVLRLKGGEVDNDVLEVDGSPHFVLNEQVILFLQGNGSMIVPLVGWTQGVFRVIEDVVTGRQVVSDHEGNRVFGIRGNTIEKEHLYASETRIIGHDRAIARSDAPDAAPGSPDDNTSSAPVQSLRQPTHSRQDAMSVQAFLNAVQAKVGQQTKQSSPIQSLSVPEFGPTDDNQDTAPTGTTRGPAARGEGPDLVLPRPLSPQ